VITQKTRKETLLVGRMLQFLFYFVFRSQGSAVSIATGYELDDKGVGVQVLVG
jgi:hypothetical protein